MFDPLGFSSSVSDEAVMWFRHSELKHGRVAMVRPHRECRTCLAGHATALYIN
jgi:hypothetical protein